MQSQFQQLDQTFQNLITTQSQGNVHKVTNALASITLNNEVTAIFFNYISSGEVSEANRLQASIFLKNYVSKNWDDLQAEKKMDEGTKQYIKDHLADLILACDRKMSENLAEIAGVIGKDNISKNWTTFLPKMVTPLSTTNIQKHYIPYYTLKKMLGKYRYAFPTEELVDDLIYIIEIVGKPLFENIQMYAKSMIELVKQNKVQQAEPLATTLALALHVFESTNYMQIPEFFEDNLDHFMSIFKGILSLNYVGESGRILKCISRTIEALTLFSQKYEEFEKFKKDFLLQIWDYAPKLSQELEHDKVIGSTVKYIISCIYFQPAKDFFQSNMNLLFQQVIYPNIVITENDLDLFQSSPEDFITQDLEEADVHTRRRNCLNLVKNLSKNFDISQIIQLMTENELKKYQENPTQNWSAKVNLINLLIGSYAIEYSVRGGATNVKMTNEEFSNVFQHCIFNEISSSECTKQNALVKAAAMKYILVFRNQIPHSWIPELICRLADFLRSNFKIIASYSCATMDKLFLLKTTDGKPVVTAEILSTYLVNLLEPLCLLLKSENNIYAIRMLYRIITLCGASIFPFSTTLLKMFCTYLNTTINNPSNATFSYLLFETIGSFIRIHKDNPEQIYLFDEALKQYLNSIIEKNISELIFYAFQILSQFLLYSKELYQYHQIMLSSLLQNPDNWKSNMKFLIPGLTQYLRSFIIKWLSSENIGNIVGSEYVQLFSTILTLRLDSAAFSFLSTLLSKWPNDQESFAKLLPAMTSICNVIQMEKTGKPNRLLDASLCGLIMESLGIILTKWGSSTFLHLFDGVQKDIGQRIIQLVTDEWKIKADCKITENSKANIVFGLCKYMEEMCCSGASQFQNMKNILITILNLIRIEPKKNIGVTGVDDFSEDNKQMLKFQQLYSTIVDDLLVIQQQLNYGQTLLMVLQSIASKTNSSLKVPLQAMLPQDMIEMLGFLSQQTQITIL